MNMPIWWRRLWRNRKFDRPGHEALWLRMSYTGWLTMPRVLMHEMPDEWQARMAKLLEEYDEQFDFSGMQGHVRTTVSIMDNGSFVKTPDWITNYRYPDKAAIEKFARARPVPPPDDFALVAYAHNGLLP